MAEKDLFHGTGNSTLAEMKSAMGLKDNTGTNKYGKQSKAPFLPTTKVVKDGWSK